MLSDSGFGIDMVWGRARTDWEICMPTEKVAEAIQLLISDPQDKVYEPWKAVCVQPRELTHTFQRFKLRGVSLRFMILPSDDCRFDIFDVDRSPSRLPYPKLEAYVQSLLEAQRRVDLDDVIDGMNLTEEWGEEHLNLDKTTDVACAKSKNEKILASVLPGEYPLDYPVVPEQPTPLKELWQECVRGKKRRIPLELLVEYLQRGFSPTVGAILV